jgi:16S rRNA (cytidine1402-2'-O)-methyltransferase
VRAALAAGHAVSPVPGPSAPVAALAVSGLPTDSFLYLGYLPRRSSERLALADQVVNLTYTLIFLESPHRLLEALEDLQASLGDRQIAIARELTKVHEEIWRGSISGGREHFTQNEPRGEFTLVIAGNKAEDKSRWTEEKLVIALKIGLKLGESPAALAGRIAHASGWNRREVYKLAVKQKGSVR